MKVLNGKITAADIKGKRAIWWHGYDGKLYHANIIGGKVRSHIRITYKVSPLDVGIFDPITFGMATATIFKDDKQGLNRIELA